VTVEKSSQQDYFLRAVEFFLRVQVGPSFGDPIVFVIRAFVFEQSGDCREAMPFVEQHGLEQVDS